jgi:glutamate dehydrogenase
LESIATLKKNPPPVSAEELAESIAFLEWLSATISPFSAAATTPFATRDGGRLEAIEGSGLGVLSDEHAHAIQRGDGMAS